MFIPSLLRLLLPSLLLPPTPEPQLASDPSLSFTPQRSFSHHPTDLSSLLVNDRRPPSLLWPDPLVLKSRRIKVFKPRNKEGYQAARFLHRSGGDSEYEDMWGGWEGVDVEAPDVEDRATLLSLAKMTSDAYILPDETGWYPIDGYNATVPIGWDPNVDRLRGHIFTNADNSTVIIALKGTSAGLLGRGGPTAKNDRINDNLLFCCCARVDFSWSTVCGCYAGSQKCGQTCVEKALIEESVYYPIATNLYNNVTVMFPNSQIWLTGHSLGGGIAALLGTTFGVPVVAFESPGDKLAAARLHLPQPPGEPGDGITHVFHTADPIPMGVCTGTLSTCYAAGFALEAKCHQGKTILYDTVNKLGWSVDIRTHSIVQVIEKILNEDWNDGDGRKEDPPTNSTDPDDGRKKRKDKGKRPVPEAQPDDPDDPCVDCYKWEFSDDFSKKKVSQISSSNASSLFSS
ncbi:Alpha/Beta hydrolase protein [Mrakia frigida]|uniref:lipase family protein n=1 Tax=Mrakia frigida TaxID=29902 RepID=UPI003FCBF9F9